MINKILTMVLSACLLLPGAAVFAQDAPQPEPAPYAIRSEWGNPIKNIINGWTEYSNGERVAIQISRNAQMEEMDLYRQLSTAIEGWSLTVYYEHIDAQTGETVLTGNQIADTDAMGAYVMRGNLPSDYFRVEGDGSLTILKSGTVAVDFYVEFYNDTPWGGFMTNGYMMADIIID